MLMRKRVPASRVLSDEEVSIDCIGRIGLRSAAISSSFIILGGGGGIECHDSSD